MAKTELTPSSYLVLGLAEQLGPATPYDLKAAAAVSVTNFWSLPHSQLYAECARLAAAGYLSERREDGGRRRRVYSITAQGTKALDRWRSEPTDEIYELRDLALLKLFFSAEKEPLAARQVEIHKLKLNEYEELLKECRKLEGESPIVLAIEAGVGHEREYIRFWSRIQGSGG